MCFAFVSVHILGIHIHHWLFLSLLALPLLERASKTPRPEAKVSLPHIELLIRGQDLGSPSGDGQVQLGTEGGNIAASPRANLRSNIVTASSIAPGYGE
jgi:hypothetical protein